MSRFDLAVGAAFGGDPAATNAGALCGGHEASKMSPPVSDLRRLEASADDHRGIGLAGFRGAIVGFQQDLHLLEAEATRQVDSTLFPPVPPVNPA